MSNVCGSCDYYNEFENGYCEKSKSEVEPENNCCGYYSLFKNIRYISMDLDDEYLKVAQKKFSVHNSKTQTTD